MVDTTPRFVHLRNHTAYSLAEGALRIPNLAAKCVELEMPAVAITDTNNMFGVPEFCQYVYAAGVQPIVGIQLDVNFGDTLPLSQLVLLVKNETGYKNLLKISSLANTGKIPGTPLNAPFDYIAENADGLIALSGGIKGAIGILAAEEKFEAAEKIALKINTAFANNFYIELQRHNLHAENKTEPFFIELAYKHNIPLVATNECFFDTRDMHTAHDILLCIIAGKHFNDPDRRSETAEHYFKTPTQMAELFADLPEAVANTLQIARRCSFKIKKSKPLMPHVSRDMDENDLIMLNSRAGLQQRFAEENITDETTRKEYLDRMSYELGVITQMGFSGYFLIVADFIGWAKKNDIPVGPGRGSGAGSIVAWALGITNLDPIRFGLLFERFLNPERVSMPDFDIDFCQDRRDEVIRYVQQKYGTDAVGQIITFGKLQPKAVIKDVGRVLHMPYGKCDDLAKLIPFKLNNFQGEDIPNTIPNLLKYERDFKELVESDDQYRALINIAIPLEGLYRHAGLHAAGVVIGDRPLTELTPLYKDEKSDIPASAYNMKYIEDTGLVKYDFLGLKTLSIIKKAVNFAHKNHGVKIDIERIPVDDEATFKMIRACDTPAVFQLESGGMVGTIRDMQPTRLEDLFALVALYRPGPMDNIPLYCRHKRGEAIDYLHPMMEPILRETYGIMVYQEQVMEMGRQLAGYSLGSADLLRRAMGKKIKEEMDKQRAVFVKGCSETSKIDDRTSNAIFDLMVKFANYGFNKAHAACYGWISYQTAYLKAHYRAEFMAASMTYDMGDTDKISMFVDNCRKNGLTVLPPDINKSFSEFSVENGAVRFALAGCKSVGIGVVNGIVAERDANGPFASIADFIGRVDRTLVNRKMLESLSSAGAFDSLEPNRAKMIANVDYILAQMGAIARDKEANQISLFATDEIESRDDIKLADAVPFTPKELLEREVEVVGFYLSAHPMDAYEHILKMMRATPIADMKDIKSDGKITVVGQLDKVIPKTSKMGKKYYNLNLSDKSGSTSLFLSERTYGMIDKESLTPGGVVAVFCDAKNGDRGMSFFTASVEPVRVDKPLAGEINIVVANKDSIGAISKVIASLPSGSTAVNLIVQQGGKEAVVALPLKYALTTATLSLFSQINGIEVRI
ncbi:MAG: DNA polymerase III subunit alpha [Alphaproteobacteria bacterium]|nr:DNA polymerase III subunit alpha [Alphaproteobacteria bacterium]